MKNILFICIENSIHSQMAHAFASIHGKNKVRAFSVGAKNSVAINPKAIAVMKELNYDLSIHDSRPTRHILALDFEYVITMNSDDACSFVRTRHREQWDVPFPEEITIPKLRKLRNLIEERVIHLIKQIGEDSIPDF